MKGLFNENAPRTKEACLSGVNAVGDALYAIGGKWKLKIIIALMDENKRFNELQRLITGISAKVLSNELKELELNGFVKKHAQEGTAAIITYELTSYSLTLHNVLLALSTWGTRHREKIMKHGVKTQVPLPGTASVNKVFSDNIDSNRPSDAHVPEISSLH